jgi:hypothetical protein
VTLAPFTLVVAAGVEAIPLLDFSTIIALAAALAAVAMIALRHP